MTPIVNPYPFSCYDAPVTLRAAIYARQSLDKSGEALAVSRQIGECRELAERNGWEVAEVYQDNDRSATSGKPRPEWVRLLADLKAGSYDVLVCWHTDRLYRRLRDLVDLVEIAQSRSLRIATVKASDLDLSNPAGRMVASLLGSVASYETEQKAARQVAANRQRAQSGVVLWTRRPFGFDRDGRDIVIVETEAAEIHKAADAVLAGATLASIAAGLNDRGIPTSSGGPWTVTAVRRVLLNPRTAGRVVSKGEDYGQGVGILDPETADRVGAILRDPKRKQAPPSTAVKYLLSGMVLCGREGCENAPMFATSNAKGVHVYRCTTCYGTRRLDSVDEVVMGVLGARLSRPDAVRLLEDDGTDVAALHAQVVELRERRDGLAELLASGLLGADAVKVQAQGLKAQIDDLERQIDDATGVDPVARVVQSGDVAAALDRLDLRTLRDVIGSLMTVRILPAGKGVRFNPEHVQIEWRRQ